MKSTTTILAEVAGKFEGMKDSATKTALALAIFGKGGKDLIPMLNEGKQGIEEWAKVAERMGLVISTQTAAQSQKFNDNLKLLDLSTKGLVNRVMEGLLPALVRLSDQFVASAKDGATMSSVAGFIVEKIKNMTVWIAAEIAATQELGKQFAALWEAMKSRTWEDLTKNIEEFNRIGRENNEVMRRAGQEAAYMFLQITVPPKPPSTDDMINPQLAKELENLSFKTRLVRGDFDNLAPGFAEAARGMGIFALTTDETRTKVAMLTPEQTKLNDALLKFRGAQITHDTLLPYETYAQQLDRLNQLLAAGVINQETYSRAIQKAADAAGTSWTSAGASIAGSFATIAGSFGEENKKMAMAAKAFAIVQAVMSAYEGASKALTLPFPANIAAAAVVLAKGFAFVASIRSQAVPHFAEGGSFKVGGFGGTDSQFVPMMLTSGEMVEITPPGESRGGRSDAPREIVINLYGDNFSQKTMRKWAAALNEAIGDGVRIRVA